MKACLAQYEIDLVIARANLAAATVTAYAPDFSDDMLNAVREGRIFHVSGSEAYILKGEKLLKVHEFETPLEQEDFFKAARLYTCKIQH